MKVFLAALVPVLAFVPACGHAPSQASSQAKSFAPHMRFNSDGWAAALAAAVDQARVASGLTTLPTDAKLTSAAIARAAELVDGDVVVPEPGQDDTPSPAPDVPQAPGTCAVEADQKATDLYVTVTDQGVAADPSAFDAQAVVQSWLAQPVARAHVLWPHADALGVAAYLSSTGMTTDAAGNEVVRFNAEYTLLVSGHDASPDECL